MGMARKLARLLICSSMIGETEMHCFHCCRVCVCEWSQVYDSEVFFGGRGLFSGVFQHGDLKVINGVQQWARLDKMW